MTMTEPNKPDRRRARPRTALYGAIVGLAASLVSVFSAAVPAHASSGKPCPNLDKSDWVIVGATRAGYIWDGYVYSLENDWLRSVRVSGWVPNVAGSSVIGGSRWGSSNRRISHSGR